jgi:hypothetical protein
MPVVRRNPEECVVELEHRDHPVSGYRNRIVNLPKYRCSACHAITPFDVGVLPGGQSPIPAAVKREFDEALETASGYEQGISDFHCRSCGRAVRVVYGIVEHHMASYYYDAKYVLEFVPNEEARG